jgi:glyoxylase-like metal-dependent hydrolase (beta-lactamase superfamily II)
LMRGYNQSYIDHRLPRDFEEAKRALASGKADDGKALSATDRAKLAANLPEYQKAVAELRGLQQVQPTVVFEQGVEIDLGNRTVKLMNLGATNTGGDAVTYLPKERILVTGDGVVHPVPYLCTGFPSEWIGTLQRMIDLNPETVVPGHGEVLHGTAYLLKVQNLLRVVVDAVRAELIQNGLGIDLEQVSGAVQRKIDFTALRREFDHGNPVDFSQSRVFETCLIRNAFYEERLR